MKKILTVELNSKKDSVEIHMNSAGIDLLINKFNSLKLRKENDHEHLMTPDWGGTDLSNIQQNTDENVKLVNHLNLYLWHE
jgi:hypothetical protein